MAKAGPDKTLQGLIEDWTKDCVKRDQLDSLVMELARSRVQEAVAAAIPRRLDIYVHSPEFSIQVKERQHYKFPLLAALLSTGLPVMAYGPASSGKTVAGLVCAEALGFEPKLIPCNRDLQAYHFNGFQGPNGQFIPGLIYQTVKDGGFVLLDELDTLEDSTATTLNALLSGSKMTFANGETVTAHKDFHVLGMANTQLTGATELYKSRQRQDYAFSDRWIMVEMPIDEGFEACLLGLNDEPSPHFDLDDGGILEERKWLEIVRKLRHWCQEQYIPCAPTVRTTLYGARCFKAGVGFRHVADSVLFRGFTPEQKEAAVTRCSLVGEYYL